MAPEETITICLFFFIRNLISLANSLSHSFFGLPFSSTNIDDPILITIFFELCMYIFNDNLFDFF